VPTAVESLRAERRRKLQVRESFSRGLAHFRANAGDPLAFYLACAGYLAQGQRRLIDQDRRLVEMLAPRVPAEQGADHRAMDALRDRLALADRSLADFEAALADLRNRGVGARARFEAAADRFLDVLVNVLGARSHSLRHLTTTLLTEEDWQRIADVTPAFLEEEAVAFAAVSRAAPAGLAPELMSTESAAKRSPEPGKRPGG
jgi:NAD(P)-dependent dehydrogenase (short-subunit alcohol dehydrogenase family)